MPVHPHLVGRQETEQQLECSRAVALVGSPCNLSHSHPRRRDMERQMECRRSLISEALVQNSQTGLLRLQSEIAHRN